MTLLTANNITATTQRVTLLDDVSLHVNTGEVVAVIGPNGAGKTSLVRALSGELTLNQGNILFNQQPLNTIELKQRARQIAVLAQHTELNFPFSIADVVHLGRIPHISGTADDNHIVTETLTAVDMNERAQQLYPQLSGGEKKRVQLARIMAQIWRAEDAPARLMILDEPTASLDVNHTRQLMRLIRKLAQQGMGIIIIVHDFNLAARYADHVVVLKKGRLVAAGKPEAVINEANMLEFFDVETRVIPHPDNGRPMVFIND